MAADLESRLAVCSWSLRPRGPDDLARLVNACGVGGVQLHLDPLRRAEWEPRATRRALAEHGVRIVSGMISMVGEDYSTLESIERTGGVRPDATWPENLAAAEANADIAAKLGVPLVTFHAGFLGHPGLTARIRAIAGVFARRGVGVALETGQESAETLAAALRDLPGVGVNFDPANMILYGMGDPAAALRTLAPYIAQVHIKDALPSPVRNQWGAETPAGQGAVDWPAFFASMPHASCLMPSSLSPLPVGLVIERESGENRVADVRTAAELVRRLAGVRHG